MRDAFTYEEIKEYINGENGNGCLLLTSKEKFLQLNQNNIPTMINLNILCACKIHNFNVTFTKFKHRNQKQCKICSNKINSLKRSLSFIDIKKYVEDELNYIMITTEKEFWDSKFINNTNPNKTKFIIKDFNGYYYSTIYSYLKANHIPRFVDKYNPYSIQNIELWLIKNQKDIILLSLNYEGNNKKLKWKCLKDNNVFYSNWADIQCDKGCPICNESKGEKEINKILSWNKISFEPQKKFDGLIGIGGGLLSYDFYLPKFNLLIEYQGEFHDGTTRKQTKEDKKRQVEHDKRKKEYSINNNIRLLEIWYYDFGNIEEILTKELQLNIKGDLLC